MMKKISYLLALLVITTSSLGSVSAAREKALTEGERRAIGVLFVDDGTAVNCSSATTVNLTGSDNAEKIWNYLTTDGKTGGGLDRKAITPEQAAGIMGNIQRESGFNPGIVERSGGGGYGLIQWTGGRRTSLENAAKARGVPVNDLGFQLDYMYEESTQRTQRDGGGKEWDGLTKIATVREATVYWEYNSERAGVVVMEQRIGFAEAIYTRFTGKQPAAPNGSGVITTNQACNTSSGQNYDWWR